MSLYLITEFQIQKVKVDKSKGEIEKSTRRVFNKFSLAIVIEQQQNNTKDTDSWVKRKLRSQLVSEGMRERIEAWENCMERVGDRNLTLGTGVHCPIGNWQGG